MNRTRISVACLLLCVAPVIGPASAQDTARLAASLKAITDGADNASRRDAIVAQLKAVGVEPRLETFGNGRSAGTNIVVTLGSGETTLLVGAHYDRIALGQGAVDNGAACAALIEVIAALKEFPISQVTLHVVFFDREENGLQGSRAYFASKSRIDFAVNIDVFAYGNAIFATRSHPEGFLARWLHTVGKEVGLPVRDVPRDRYPASDHQTMMAAGVETLGVALLDASEIDGVIGAVTGRGTPGNAPRVLKIIHTADDTLDHVRPQDMTRGITLLEQLIRVVDRAQ